MSRISSRKQLGNEIIRGILNDEKSFKKSLKFTASKWFTTYFKTLFLW